MGFAVRVGSAGQKYGPTCHQRDRADVTEFVTLVRLSSLGQHVGVLALAGYKRRIPLRCLPGRHTTPLCLSPWHPFFQLFCLLLTKITYGARVLVLTVLHRSCTMVMRVLFKIIITTHKTRMRDRYQLYEWIITTLFCQRQNLILGRLLAWSEEMHERQDSAEYYPSSWNCMTIVNYFLVPLVHSKRYEPYHLLLVLMFWSDVIDFLTPVIVYSLLPFNMRSICV